MATSLKVQLAEANARIAKAIVEYNKLRAAARVVAEELEATQAKLACRERSLWNAMACKSKAEKKLRELVPTQASHDGVAEALAALYAD